MVPDKKKFTNHLKDEKSPYLKQHAHNPVDWYPWGEEAFQKALYEDKPVFLSIGYSTCHWCHVMARESFQDEEIGQILNQYFVSVKVDREERPDIDSIYMTVCQMMTGSGGWPLTIILTPNQEPFYAGTYFPRMSVGRGVGLKDLLLNVKDMWSDKKQELLDSAQDIRSALEDLNRTAPGDLLDLDAVDGAYQALKDSFDQENGGFGSFQKFPTPHHLLFLLRYWRATGKEEALVMVESTLEHMIRGGLWDHVGYGFHRYSVDPHWLVPHYEKMLYDQALITLALTECYQATHKTLYRETVEKTLEYVFRDMKSLEGGFYSAEDADSEKVEGKFYLWTHQELSQILDPGELELVEKVYRVQEKGNYREESTGQYTGHNILHLEEPLEESAHRLGLGHDELKNKLEMIRVKLFKARMGRVRPHKDEKVLTDWNGLMLVALARASVVLDNQDYLDTALNSLDFIKSKLYRGGRLWHRYHDGEVKVEGYLDDYAFLGWGALELHQATQETDYLKLALELTQTLLDHFLDQDDGGFYFTAGDAEKLLLRKKEAYDTALPSGNSVAYHNLLRLSQLLEDQELNQQALQVEKAFAHHIKESPTGFSMFLAGALFRLEDSCQVVVSGAGDDTITQRMLGGLKERYLPHVTLLLNSGEDEWLKTRVESLSSKTAKEGGVTVYVCCHGICHHPTSQLEDVLRILEKK